MSWIGTLIAFVTGEHIQVSTIQMNAMLLKLCKVSSYVIGCLGRTEIRLRTACPAGVLRNRTVCQPHGIIFIKRRSVLIIITILVMDTEEIAQPLHGIRKRFHFLPAAGFFTGRQVIRMLVVIARLCPAVQMKIKLFHTEIMKSFHFLFPYSKGSQGIIFLRGFRIKEFRFRIYAGLDPFMYKGGSDQTIHRRDPGSFLFQCCSQIVFKHILPVDLTHGIVITVFPETVSHDPPVIHRSETWFPAHGNMGKGTSCRMFQLGKTIPGSQCDGNIAFSFPDLGKPGHITACCTELPLKMQGTAFCLPGVWDQKALPFVDQGIPVFFRFLKCHGTRPE